MFENAGQKIKTLAKICFWIFAVLFVVLAFTVGKSRWGGIIPAIFWPFLIGGPLLSYIGSLFLYGFGELVESSEETKKNSARAGKYCERLYNMLKDEAEPKGSGEVKAGSVSTAGPLRIPDEPAHAVSSAPAAPLAMPKNLDAGGWRDHSE